MSKVARNEPLQTGGRPRVEGLGAMVTTTTTTVGVGCAILFGERKAQAMQDLIEGATGKPCPCRSGEGCPLLPAVWRDENLAEPIAEVA